MNTTGIGLGLVISENIVKSFGGAIGVKSKYGRGTKFAFSILLGKDEDYIDHMNMEEKIEQPSLSLAGSSEHIQNNSKMVK